MSCTPRAPRVTWRDLDAITRALAANRAGYTPPWRSAPGSGDPGLAVNRILARFIEIQNDGLNAMPLRLQLEHLAAIGTNVLAPQPARAPLVFTLLPTASGDASVAQGTRVAAVLPPPPPSLVGDASPAPAPAPEFATEQAFTAMRGSLAALYSIDPDADVYADHTADLATGFKVFDGMVPAPHRLYLGLADGFKLTGAAEIVLSFDFATSAGGGGRPYPDACAAPGPAAAAGSGAAPTQRPLLLDWEYLSADGWQPLTLVQDGTERFTRDGKVTLAKFNGPDSKAGTVAGFECCWIRGTVSADPPFARIATEPAGYLLRYAAAAVPPPLQAGDAVEVLGHAGTSVVAAAYDGRLVLASPLAAALPGATLQKAGGAVLGSVIGSPPHFRIAVESARQLLPGDAITLDGATRATILQTDDASLFLDAALTGAEPGLTVELADALPPLRPAGADTQGALPEVDLIRARVGFGKTGLVLDSAYLDGAKLDVSKNFHPFGTQPAAYAAFYLACKEAFSLSGARIELQFVFDQTGTTKGAPTVVAEFYNGARWQPLGPNDDHLDDTASFTSPQPGDTAFPNGRIGFTVPGGWVESAVNGETARWLRLRLAAGDFGQPVSIEVVKDPNDPTRYVVNAAPATLQPPIVASLGVDYYYFTNPQPLDRCVTENDFAFADHTDDARWPRSPFAPFVPVSDRTPALHFGFDARPPQALVSLLVQVGTAAVDGDPQPYVWDYWGVRGWTELSVRDATLGLRQTGLVQFVGAPDALPRAGVGGELYAIRARLKPGLQSRSQIVACGGAWLNAMWARQGQSVSRDGLGTSNGNPGQSYALPMVRAQAGTATLVGAGGTDAVALNAGDFEHALDTVLAGVPILGDETLEVREWSGRGDDWQTVLGAVDLADVRFEVDPQDPTIATAAWVRWHAQPHFYRSGPDDRHYVVERARGVFRFPGADGRVPPAGAPIVVSYVTGGGSVGNVPAGTVRELRSGVGFVQSVTNPIAASGGAAAELLRGARDRGVQSVRHRGRAVSYEDYESLALAASSEVARVRALPLAGPDGNGARGCVGLVLVPHGDAAQPQPSDELRRTVLAALAPCVPAGIAAGLRTFAPDYVPVGVRAEILPLRAEDAGRVEAAARARLAAFLHPLNGAATGRGWAFGEAAYLSSLAALLEDTPGVDAVRFLQLMVGQAVYGDSVPVAPGQLVCAGDSQLKILVPVAGAAHAAA